MKRSRKNISNNNNKEPDSQNLTTISHEIRTPLNGVLGALTLLTDTPLSSEQKQLVHIAQLCGEQILLLVNDVLERAKLLAGKLILELVSFDLHELLAVSMELFSTIATGKGLELILDIHPLVPQYVVGDPFRIRQVLSNLIGNACKFTKEGHVLLKATSTSVVIDSFDLLIDVTDTGVGISLTSPGGSFHPFMQGDQFTGGTGLGLNIARQLAELMKGTVTFNSEQGRGSTFHFSVPLNKPLGVKDDIPVPFLPRGELLSLESALEKAILLVIRNTITRQLLSSKLTSWGFSVSSVATSVEALAYKPQLPQQFRLLVADINGHSRDADLVQAFHTATILLRHGGEQERLVFATERKPRRIVVFKPIRDVELRKALARALLDNDKDNDTMDDSERALLLEEKHNLASLSGDIATAGGVVAVNAQAVAGLRILIVDDNITNQLVVAKLLARLGQKNVVIACDGVEAVEACRTSGFDLVLMDVLMNGNEASRTIRAIRAAQQQLLIVGLTASSLQADCIKAGMDIVITKPIKVKDLRDAVNAAIEHAAK